MAQTEVGYLARHAPLIDAMRHGDRDARRRGRLAQEGLVMTAIQAHYAQYLVRAPRGLAMSTLAEHTGTTLANVSQIATRMERLGLVRRRLSDTDYRSVVVHVTAYGTHQFWLLVTRMRRIEALYRTARTRRTARGALPAALKATAGRWARLDEPPVQVWTPWTAPDALDRWMAQRGVSAPPRLVPRRAGPTVPPWGDP
ncbi:MarR family transcriptional regulator [Demequina sp.]|uniref:MarR family transcriptional regulator n=1 Tax=Demequina sp. TaxID=2050685 RepID=UPI003A8561D0